MTVVNQRYSSLHIAFVLHSYAPLKTPQATLDAQFTTMEWAHALSKIGVKVSVFHRYSSNHTFSIDSINLYFIGDQLPPELRSYHLAYSFHKKVVHLIEENKIDIIHAHNTFALFPNLTLRILSGRRLMLIQDHSGRQILTRKYLRKLALKRVDAVVFSSEGQEQPWTDSGILSKEQCHFVMENSSKYKYEDRVTARQKTKLKGEPLFLWVGNLDMNKDPYTVLRAFSKFVKNCPAAHLYMIYRLSNHEDEVKLFIEADKALSQHVTMLGGMARNELEAYYNSGDYIVSASHKEAGGFSIIEAMSCGVIPIVTKIPSFNSLTGDGKIGLLFEAGNAEMLYEKLMITMNEDIYKESEAVRIHFAKHFSFSALANNLKSVYMHLLERHD